MKKLNMIIVAFIATLSFSCNPKDSAKIYETKTATEEGYTYSYVTNDPLKTRIYTLENGLKVYLSVYKDAPRIQTYIAVNAGGKDDPSHATGLAHYLEHMMFKGTSEFGTTDWESEKILLDSIENMFNHYASLTDPAKRKAYYKLIDKVSNEAAKFAIANEYDKMVSKIGAKGTNAYTSNDRTVYINDIPSNEFERWLEIESNRFTQIVNRLFHTELETVYEEKNRSLDSDGSKLYEKLQEHLFPNHQYGTQTVIGTIEHLKNPSITEIKKYFAKNYVPNNMAVCLSGDFDPNQTIKLIDQYFGKWEKKDHEPTQFIEEAPLTSVSEFEVFGPEAESVVIGFRLKPENQKDKRMLSVVDMMLSNTKAGIIDLNLKQKQKVLEPGCWPYVRNDYSMHIFYGKPRQGQTLEEVKELLLEQIDMLKKGEFEDWLVSSVITDLKVQRMKSYENNSSRAHAMVGVFNSNTDWVDYVKELDEMANITREDIIQFVNDNYGDNYAVGYKKTGEDPEKQNVEKPFISKVEVNRNAESEFFKRISSKQPAKIEPVFVNYKKVEQGSMKAGVPVVSNKNNDNELFNLYYLLEIGNNHDPKLSLAVEYLQYLGTDSLSAEDFNKELYKLGCSFNVHAGEDQVYVMLSGLDENMEEAMQLFEGLLSNPKPDEEALQKVVEGILKKREDMKKSKYKILHEGLANYAKYGPKSPFTNVITNDALKEIKADELTKKIKELTSFKHKVLYYGPREQKNILSALNQHHLVPANLKDLPEPIQFKEIDNPKTLVYWTDFDMVQAEIIFTSKRDNYDKMLIPSLSMYNQYFGGGMNSIVFQEMREAQALAYSVWSNYTTPNRLDKSHQVFAYIGTQADKLPEAMRGMMELINDMPESENAFNTAKESLLSKIETERITKANILFNFENAQKLNLDYDIRKDIYEAAKTMTLEDVKKFQLENVKNKNYNIMVLGSKDKLNFKELQKYGKVKELTLDELFGFDKETNKVGKPL